MPSPPLPEAGIAVRDLHIAPMPGASAAARRLVTEGCAAWGMPELTVDATLVVSELVANAVEHARSEVVVRISRRAEGVRIEVHDGDTRMPRPAQHDGVLHLRGRGLLLIQAMCPSWGAMPTATGKVVWANLRRL